MIIQYFPADVDSNKGPCPPWPDDQADATVHSTDMLEGVIASNDYTKVEGNIQTHTGYTVSNEFTSWDNERTIISNGYFTGDIILQGDADLIPSNIVKDETIYNVVGTGTPGSVDQFMVNAEEISQYYWDKYGTLPYKSKEQRNRYIKIPDNHRLSANSNCTSTFAGYTLLMHAPDISKSQDVANLKVADHLFRGDIMLQEVVDFSVFPWNQITSAAYMYYDCSIGLRKAVVENTNPELRNLSMIFSRCKNLEEATIDLRNNNWEGTTDGNISNAFNGDSKLTKLTLGFPQTENCEFRTGAIVTGCTNLVELRFLGNVYANQYIINGNRSIIELSNNNLVSHECLVELGHKIVPTQLASVRVKLGYANMGKMSADDIAIFTSKNVAVVP